jgi:ATP-dependent DNA helicase RecQ
MAQDLSPDCPKCGDGMMLRTARKGANAGSQFWGCIKYPKCKGTKDFTSESISLLFNASEPQSLITKAITPTERPRPLLVASASKERRTQFYEGIAVPRATLKHFNLETYIHNKRGLSQWVAEWPRGFIPRSVSESPSWLAVLGKIIRRGSVIPMPNKIEVQLEKELETIYNISDTEWDNALSEIYSIPNNFYIDPNTFDSDAERDFFDKILPRLHDSRLRWLWQRQVAVGSLTGEKNDLDANQRIDFLFSLPGCSALVVEIDGEQHLLQKEQDNRRDALLLNYGIRVIRISTNEIKIGSGKNIDELKNFLNEQNIAVKLDFSPACKWLLAGRRVQQINLVLLETLEKGYFNYDGINPIKIYLKGDITFDSNLDTDINKLAIDDFNEIIADIAACHGHLIFPQFEISQDTETALTFCFSEESHTKGTVINIYSAYLPASPDIETPSSRPFSASQTNSQVYEKLLFRIFGYSKFREGQLQAVERSIKGHDSLILLPTGSGKSIAFQLAAFLRPGVAIIIDPLLSLIDDQIENLKSHGIDRAQKISGAQSTDEREDIMSQLSRSQHFFCYIAPERFQSSSFRDSLRSLTTNTPVSLVVVDEVHCVSEWGHDFRPAYLNLARIAREYCSTGEIVPPIMGLTGTASRSVLKDIQRELEILDFEAVLVPKSFNRPELSFEAIGCKSAEKSIRIKALVDRLPASFGMHRTEFYEVRDTSTQSGLLFCPHVNGDNGVLEVARIISNHLGVKVPTYASTPQKDAPKGSWASLLRETAEGFKRNKFPIMSCTKAFGMGIDKPNIRFTIHFNLPPSIESFYQEAGRAGRDGKSAKCFILFSDDFPARTSKLLNPITSSTQDIQRELDEAGWDKADDITRALYFHRNAFKGAAEDNLILNQVIQDLGNLEKPNRVILRFENKKPAKTTNIKDQDELRKVRERALHRLIVIGALADYTIDFSKREFHVLISGIGKEEISNNLYKYISGYQRQRATKAFEVIKESLALQHNEFIAKAGNQLIEFIYDVIERSRRQALSEILRVCKRATNSDSIRQDILNYLDRSKFADQIEVLLDGDQAGIGQIEKIVEEIRSSLEAEELRGECARELESYPDQPSLRLLLGFSEIMTRSPDKISTSQNIEAAIRDGLTKYGLSQEIILNIVINVSEMIAESRPEMAKIVLSATLNGSTNGRDAARIMIKRLRPNMLGPAIAYIIKGLTYPLKQLTRT